MSKKYDTSFKEMFAQNFLALLRWLLPNIGLAEVVKLPEELPLTARRADLIIRVKLRSVREAKPGPDLLIIFECQCQHDVRLHESMLLRAVLAHTLHRLPVKTIVLALAPQAVIATDHVFGQGPDGDALRHRVTVRRVFEECADDALASGIAELLPLVTTMQPRDGDPEALVRRVVENILLRVASDEKRKIMLGQAATFATLRLPPNKVNGIVKAVVWRNRHMLDPLRDFPYLRWGYRKGKAEGLAKGEARGVAKGKAEGKAEGRTEGKAESVLTILEARGVRVTKSLREKILSCTDGAVLDGWLRSAASASSAADVIGGRS